MAVSGPKGVDSPISLEELQGEDVGWKRGAAKPHGGGGDENSGGIVESSYVAGDQHRDFNNSTAEEELLAAESPTALLPIRRRLAVA